MFVPESDPLKKIKDTLISSLILKGREPWDLCVIESGLPVDTTLAVAYVITEDDSYFLSQENFPLLFQKDSSGSIPIITRSGKAFKYIKRCMKYKLEDIEQHYNKTSLVDLVDDRSLPFHLTQIYKLQLQEYDILKKLYSTSYQRWNLYSSLKKYKRSAKPN